MDENKMVEANVEETVEEVVVSSDESSQEDSIEIAINKLFSKAFTTLPMIIRVKYLVDTLDKIPEDEVSFSRVNTMVHSNISEGDFNILPEEIKTKKDIIDLYNRVCSGASGLSTWCKRVCKDCGKEFFMYLSEVDFYRGKGFAFPKRCKNCINIHKNQQKT